MNGDIPGFSWSARRQAMFEFCRRACYLHYYAAGGGWDAYASDSARLAYRLKHIRHAEDWCVESLADAVAELFALPRPRTFPRHPAMAAKLKELLARRAAHAAASITGELWREDPKSPNIFEVYYGSASDRAERAALYLRQRLAQLHHYFVSGELFPGLCNLEPMRFKNLARPQNFTIGDLEIWIAPTLAWQEDEQLNILYIKSSSPVQTENCVQTAELSALMASQLFHIPGENVSSILYFCGQANQQPEIIRPDIVREYHAPAAIRHSANRMLDLVRPGNHADIADFPGWNVPQVCSACRFKEFCRDLSTRNAE